MILFLIGFLAGIIVFLLGIVFWVFSATDLDGMHSEAFLQHYLKDDRAQ